MGIALNTLGESLETTPAGMIHIYILGYNRNKNLIGNPSISHGIINRDRIPSVLMQNINNYLTEFKLLTDDIVIKDGFIINFGVKFNVTAHRFVNKKEVKLRCINVIQNYFNINKKAFY